MALPLDGYIRVSKVGGRDKDDGFISPDVQERAIRDTAQRGGHDIHMHQPELDVSGGTMDRPIFNQIMGRIRDGRSGGLIVYKTDRFARSVLGAITTLEELGAHKAAFVSATEPALDYSTPAGRAFLQQLFVFGEFTRNTLKESWATSQRFAVERGIHISPNAKRGGYLGYSVGPDRRLVPDEQAPIAREMLVRSAARESWGSIAKWLNDVAPRPDGTLWTGLAVSRLCANRIYRGEAFRYVVQDKDGRGPMVNPDAHEAIVTEEEWQAAQGPRQAARGGPNTGKPLPLLSGIIRCAGCRYGMSLGTGPKGQRLYRCRTNHASGKCPSPTSILTTNIERYVEEHVLAEIDGIVRSVPDSAERDQAVATLEYARADLNSFRDDRVAHRKLGAEWHEWLDGYLTAVREAEQELEQIDSRVGIATRGLTRDHYLALPSDDRREVLGGFIDCVFVRRSTTGRGRHSAPLDARVRIMWAGQAPGDLPRRRRVNEIRSFEFKDEVAAGSAATQDSA